MKTRTWPYGTRLPVTVLEANRSLLFVISYKESPVGEGFALLNHGIKELPGEKSEGFITFRQGGPTGGYWEFSKT